MGEDAPNFGKSAGEGAAVQRETGLELLWSNFLGQEDRWKITYRGEEDEPNDKANEKGLRRELQVAGCADDQGTGPDGQSGLP
ncbi:hypothetical protein AGMMS50256_27860 [Betaproteobacteria bacterium]|nr:hypothetical protein AGMMS50256_27860 [Betaproteobacteria bacterium]